jgi:hypothetical protein
METSTIINTQLSPAAAAFSGVVAGCVLLHRLASKTSLPPSERLNFEDKALRKRFTFH